MNEFCHFSLYIKFTIFGIVKKLIAIGLVFSFLSSTTEAHELFKIPHLITHYFEHDADIPLGEFLHIHYAHDHENHQDEHHDNGCLPFQGNHSCGISVNAFYFQGSDSFNLEPSSANSDSYILLKESAQSNYHSHIWQPPKIA